MDWREERVRALADARCIIFKVGSAVLTNDAGISNDAMHRIAAQIASIPPLKGGERRRIVLVTSAAVAAGKSVLKARNIAFREGLAGKQAAAAVGQGRIIYAWEMAFLEFGIATAQILLTRDDLRAKERLLNARNTFFELLSWGVIPVVNENDTTSIDELRFGDNDTLSSLLANLVGADLCVNLTSAEGVIDMTPGGTEELIPCIQDVGRLNLSDLCGEKTTVGTGGMRSKLLAARRMAQSGIPTCILPGKEPGIISRLFAGKDAGTWVRPFAHAVPNRKFWLAYRSAPVGSIEIDDGAAIALLKKGSSLLPVGVVGIEGAFMAGSLVRVMHRGVSLGVGLSNYSSVELDKIKGMKSQEVERFLEGYHYPEAIHRDNLLLNAAI